MALIEPNWKPDRRQLQLFGGVGMPIFLGLIGALVRYKTGNAEIAGILWACAALSLVSWVAPNLIRPVYLVLVAVTLPIGLVISTVIMALIFYGVILPIGIGMRIAGRDPLLRKLEPEAKSYWIDHPPPAEPARYFRQF